MWRYDFNIIILPIHHTGGILVIYSAIEKRSIYLVSTLEIWL